MEKARHAINGSPSPWNVFAIMAKEASVRERRVYVSVLESAGDVVEDDIVADCRRTMLEIDVILSFSDQEKQYGL